jgi:hypothetical protein
MTSGDQVYLRASGNTLIVENIRGEYLGKVEPKLGVRLVKLMEGGNRYAAAIASLAGTQGKLIIKEIFQHPSQAGRASFPSREDDGFRPYIRESLIRYGLEGDEVADEEDGSEWGEEEESLHDGFSLLESDSADHDKDEVLEG